MHEGSMNLSLNDIKQVLRIITDNIKDNEPVWRLDGSANLKLQGVDVKVRDIDIATDDNGVRIFKNCLSRYVVKDFFNKKINSDSLICNINGFEIEINNYKNEKLCMFDKIKYISWEDMNIPILPLIYAKRFYELIDRKDKVKLLGEILRKHMIV
ncbi:hypothetical protein J7J26_03380 [Candidatus Micrarchaeota archaeon]|nr:hypothetical protein [Candidatus Micrarchaeota archaeon]